jgi:hypothetical protein
MSGSRPEWFLTSDPQFSLSRNAGLPPILCKGAHAGLAASGRETHVPEPIASFPQPRQALSCYENGTNLTFISSNLDCLFSLILSHEGACGSGAYTLVTKSEQIP